MRKKSLLVIITVLLTALCGNGRSIKFVYIAHNVDTPIDELMSKLEYYHDDLGSESSNIESPNRTIIYMASSTNPIIADMRSGNTDDDNYERIMREFDRNYHEVNGEFDTKRIIELFSNADDFLDYTGRLAKDVDDITFEFYITPIFWSTEQHQSLIAPLFFALGLNRLMDRNSATFSNEVSLSMYFPTIEDMRKCKGEKDEPFGDRNINNINVIIGSNMIGTYD